MSTLRRSSNHFQSHLQTVASLFVIQGRDQGTRFELDSDSATFPLGREAGNRIQLHDTEVSRHHAEIRRAGEQFVLSDLGSSNGTFVNNQRVERRELASGDQVQIGRTVMLFTGPSEAPSSSLGAKIDIFSAGSQTDPSRIVHTVSQQEGSQFFSAPADKSEGLWLARARSNLQVMYRTALAVSHTLDIDQLLGRIMQLIFEWVEADRGCIMLVDPETKELQPKVRRDRKGRRGLSPFPESAEEKGTVPLSVAAAPRGDDKISISQTILDYVLERREGVLTSDARQDDRWDTTASIMRMGVREAICVPMQGRYDIVGVVYIDTLTPATRVADRGGNRFTEEHLKLMVAIGHQAALAVEDTKYYSAMVQSERLAAVGQTIASLSHHIKNILQGIRGGSYLIEMGLAEHDEQVTRKGWHIVERNQKRISSLVLDMLTFSKEREPEFAAADLNGVVGDVVELMRARAEELKVVLRFEPDTTIPSLTFDSEGIHRAVLNIATNALDACDERDDGIVTISTRQLAVEGLVQIVIDDNGAGIPPENLEQIFNPFFSSKGSRGTGLGLAVSQKILKEHGGRILVESRPAEGSRFTLEFPALAATEGGGQTAADSGKPSSDIDTQLPADATPVSSGSHPRADNSTTRGPDT
jgi:two-component system NtrC family sensor kinase